MSPHPEVRATVSALKAVRDARFLATERGFHGAFYCELRTALRRRRLLGDGRILEMEYQKSARQGIRQRPDIILHIPADIRGTTVRENNFAVWALKRAATEQEAREDFAKLDQMCITLCYPLALFVNVAATQTHLAQYLGPFRERIHGLATPVLGGLTLKHSYFVEGELREEEIRL
jgi:hypothetical protein